MKAHINNASGIKVLYRGTLQLGTTGNISCANIQVGDRKLLRVISEESFFRIIGVRSPQSGVKLCGTVLLGKNIQNPKTQKLMAEISNPIEIKEGAFRNRYYDNSVLIGFANRILDLRREKALGRQWNMYAENCERFIQGLAHVGFAALIDEATGYAKAQKDEYQNLFKQYIRDAHGAWVKEFPDSFFDGVYKIYHLTRIGRNHPSFFGKFIAKYVYWPLANSKGEILKLLREKDPMINDKERRYRLHQFLTEDIGKKVLHEHMGKLDAVFALSHDKDSFARIFKRVVPQSGDQMEFELGFDDI